MSEHPSEEDMERYCRSELGEADAVVLEHHLLVCERCIHQIKGIDEYVRIMRTALQELQSDAPAE